MNLASYFANKCLEFLLAVNEEKEGQGAAGSISIKKGSARCYPPWIGDIQYFKHNCDGCGHCIDNCEYNVLFLNDTNFPAIDFSKGECSFCGDCAKSCSKGLFDYAPAKTPWHLKAFITSKCLSHNSVLCRTCIEHCNEEAIVVSQENGSMGTPYVLAEKCNGCGACFRPCPVGAISIKGNNGEESS